MSSRLWFLSMVAKLHGSIIKGQISTNQCMYMLSLKSWIKSSHFLKCGSRHTGSTAINILNGASSIVPLVWLLHVQRLQNYLLLSAWKDILKLFCRPLIQVEREFLVDSSFINWVYYNQVAVDKWKKFKKRITILVTRMSDGGIGNVISSSSNFSIKNSDGTNFSYSAIV